MIAIREHALTGCDWASGQSESCHISSPKAQPHAFNDFGPSSKLFGNAVLLVLALGLNSARAADATPPATPAPAAAAAPQTPPAQPSGTDLAAINSALKTVISNSDAGAKAVFDKYPNYNPIAPAGGGRGAGGGAAAGGPPPPPDPSIAKLLPFKSGVGDGEYVIGPTYTNAPEITYKDGVPKGQIYQFVMNSADSKIFPGAPARGGRNGAGNNGAVVPFDRHVTVYVPAQYVPGTAVPVMIAQDGYTMYSYPLYLPR